MVRSEDGAHASLRSDRFTPERHERETGLVTTYSQTCPRCGDEFSGDDIDTVSDAVVAHARQAHHHELDRAIVRAHLEGVHPND